MVKKLKDLTKNDICNTCAKYSNNFMSDCDKNCPFYMEHGFSYRFKREIHTTTCKTDYKYITKYPDETVNLDD